MNRRQIQSTFIWPNVGDVDYPDLVRRVITLAAGMATGLFAQIRLIEHLFGLLSPALGAQASGGLVGGGTACAIVGRAVAARAVMHTGDRRLVAAASYGIQALGALLLLLARADQVWLIVLGVALFGTGIGNATSLPPLIAQADLRYPTSHALWQ